MIGCGQQSEQERIEDRSVQSLYLRSCASCHAAGRAGAPVSHNVDVWKALLAKGDEALLRSVVQGYRGMPAKGMCRDCTDEEFKGLIDYMAGPSSLVIQ